MAASQPVASRMSNNHGRAGSLQERRDGRPRLRLGHPQACWEKVVGNCVSGYTRRRCDPPRLARKVSSWPKLTVASGNALSPLKVAQPPAETESPTCRARDSRSHTPQSRTKMVWSFGAVGGRVLCLAGLASAAHAADTSGGGGFETGRTDARYEGCPGALKGNEEAILINGGGSSWWRSDQEAALSNNQWLPLMLLFHHRREFSLQTLAGKECYFRAWNTCPR